MDNVLREIIRTEIKAILGDKEPRNEAPKTQTEKIYHINILLIEK